MSRLSRSKPDGAPKRAPRKLNAMTDVQLADAITDRCRYLQHVNTAAQVPASRVTSSAREREATLTAVRETVDDVKRLEAERAQRAASGRATTMAADARIADRSPTAGLQAAHEWRKAAKATKEAAWERRRREEAKQAAERKAAEHARQTEYRARQSEQGLAPPEPGAWSGWDAASAETLAAVFSDPTLWHEWAGRDPDKLDRNPPLHSSHLLVLYAALATMAARGTREVVVTRASTSSWMPVGFVASHSGAGTPSGASGTWTQTAGSSCASTADGCTSPRGRWRRQHGRRT